MVVVQDELQNHCRSRETCSFGTPDAVVCKAARSASAVLAAVGPSVGIGARAGAGFGKIARAAAGQAARVAIRLMVRILDPSREFYAARLASGNQPTRPDLSAAYLY